jgi:hypothetical protein
MIAACLLYIGGWSSAVVHGPLPRFERVDKITRKCVHVMSCGFRTRCRSIAHIHFSCPYYSIALCVQFHVRRSSSTQAGAT